MENVCFFDRFVSILCFSFHKPDKILSFLMFIYIYINFLMENNCYVFFFFNLTVIFALEVDYLILKFTDKLVR
jgi:hypothetical protein